MCKRVRSKKRRVAATVCDCDCYCCYRINATYILERDDMVRISGVFKKRFAQEKSMKHCLSLSQRDLTRFKMLNGCQSVRVCALLHTHITQTDINLYSKMLIIPPPSTPFDQFRNSQCSIYWAATESLLAPRWRFHETNASLAWNEKKYQWQWIVEKREKTLGFWFVGNPFEGARTIWYKTHFIQV